MSRGPDPDVSARKILLYFVQSPDAGFTANEVADEFDISRQGADHRLKRLQERGLVNSKNPGGRARFYWATEEGRQLLKDTRKNS